MIAFPLNIEIFTGRDKTDRPDQSMFQPVQAAGLEASAVNRKPFPVASNVASPNGKWL